MNKLTNDRVQERDVAIVLTDIIGSTKFVQRVGDRKAAQWFAVHDRHVHSLLAKFEGTLSDASDGHLMYFNNVADAIAFGFSYKKFLVDKKIPFRSRVGIHWGRMLIVHTPENLVRANHKRIALEGIGKNIAARTMSLCAENQILLSQAAYVKFKSRIRKHPYIPSDVLSVLVGLYKFKGVSEPEAIYALGTEQSHLQPPPDSEKAKRLGGKGKIRTRLRQKKLKEIIEYFFWRIGFIFFVWLIWQIWPLLRYFDFIDTIHYVIISVKSKLLLFISILEK